MIKRRFLSVGLFCLSACTVGPDYHLSQEGNGDDWSTAPGENVSRDPIKLDWWTVFNDALLEQYIHQSAEHNKDVQVALANLRRARALRREEEGAFWPQIGADAGFSRTQSSDAVSSFNSGQTRNLFDVTFDASWELDIFGGNRRAVEAADARLQSSWFDYQGVLLSTLSEVARNYFEARGLQKRIAITQENAGLLKQTFDLINIRLQVGEASRFDLSRARGEYQLTLARLPNLQADLHASIFSLSVLLGQPPDALLQEMQQNAPLPVPPDMVPVGLRSEILRRRPDIHVAERELAASIADIGVETAELFPKFFLTGDLGSQARMFGDLFTMAGGVWSFASMLRWSIFEGGAIRARIKAAEAQSEAALALYEKAVLEALADAETALTHYGQELETRKRLDDGVRSRRQSVKFAKELFDAGEEDYLAVLDAERELTATEDDLVISETQSIVKLIALYAALGGGWEMFDVSEAYSLN